MNDEAQRPEAPPPPETLRGIFAARDGFMRALGIEVLELGRGSARLAMEVRPQHLNFNGTCHGGAIFALADSAFGVSSNSYGVLAAGIDAHITYNAAPRLGDRLTATSREISRTRKIAVYRIDVAAEKVGLVATFTGTVYIIGRPNYP
jgi:phenylacetic acid degradation protein PaaD